MGLFNKKDKALEVDKQVIHDIRKELRPEYERLRLGLKMVEELLIDVTDKVKTLRADIYDYVTSVDAILAKLE